MSRILGFLLKQQVALNIIFVALMIFGIGFAFKNIPIDQFPNINLGKYTITTVYPGASAENVERLVTEELEESLRDMEGIDYVKSTSIAGLSIVIVQFLDDLDFEDLYSDLRMRILGVQNLLPVVNGKSLAPSFMANDIDEWAPVIQVNLQHISDDPQLQPRSLSLLAKELRSQLERIPHVKKVLLFGIEAEQYEIAIDPNLLEANDLTLEECIQVLRQSGHIVSGGNVQSKNGEMTIILDDVANKPDDIFTRIIRSDTSGNHVELQSIIDWQHTGIHHIHGGIRTSFNGKDNVTCKIIKTSRGNASTIKQQVLKICESFVQTHQQDRIQCLSSLDSTHLINDSINTLATSLIAACVLVVLTLFWFLTTANKRVLTIGSSLALIAFLIIAMTDNTLIRSLALAIFMFYIFYYSRSSVLVFSGIIFSFIGSIIVFYFVGYSLNEITLLGFVLTIGIIVDDAIIVLENIRRHRESGEELYDAAVNGTSEVFWPVVSATLTTLAAFLPMLIMTGMIGQFFSLVPKAVSIALFISLIECIIFLPLHTVDLSRLLGEEKFSKRSDKSFLDLPGFIGRLHRIYDRLLHWVFAHPIKTLTSISSLLLLSCVTLAISNPQTASELGISPPLRLKFFPSDITQLWIRVSMPHGSSSDDTDSTCRRVAKLIHARPAGQVDNITTISGLSLDSSYNPHHSHQNAFLMVELCRGESRSFDDPNVLLNDIDQQLKSSFSAQGIRFLVEAKKDGPPVGSPVNIQISGVEDAVVERLAKDLFNWVQSEMRTDGVYAGINTLFHDRQQSQSQLQFTFNQRKLANHGISPLQAQQHLATIYDGAWIGNLRRIDEDIPIRVKMSQQPSKNIDQMLSLPIATGKHGQVVRFSDVGRTHIEAHASSLIRKNFQRTITISGTLKQDALYTTAFISRWYDKHKEHYAGASISFGGEAEGTSRSYESLMVSFFIAIFLIYAILAAQFKSYLQQLIIMSNIVFAFIGVVLVMSLFGIGAQILGPDIIRPERSWFTMQCFMAVIGLAGLVVNDAIVLIDFINQRRREGMSLDNALFTAGHQRMRAIVMTTITTIAGLLPMAIGLPEFSLRWSPFATAFIAGITVSTAMTLLIIPLFYKFMDAVSSKSASVAQSYRDKKSTSMQNLE
ncbi:MAG: efflux RND transporter permease subunit [Planctomycetes bacterium]|nr:efflux RND transporter permease subunit [Planctomycetota bacterium]